MTNYSPRAIILIVLMLSITCLAWTDRFIQDDAFITFRYSYNLVHGSGPVWNPGERVEGYTNFLWMLIIAAGLALKTEPVLFSFAIGLITFMITLLVTYKLGVIVLTETDSRPEWWAMLTVLLLGSNFSFRSYATGGLETQLQACLFVSSAYLLIKSNYLSGWTPLKGFWMSLLLSTAMMTRLDSAVLSVVVFISAIITIFRQKTRKKTTLAALMVPFSIIIGGWFIWKLTYYGDILPNSFYIRRNSFMNLAGGAYYIYYFFGSYLLLPAVLLVIISIPKMLPGRQRRIIIPLVITLLWLCYVVFAGGDFMEFRFIVPVMPFLFLLIVSAFKVLIKHKALQYSLIALVLFGSIRYSFNSKWQPARNGVDTIHSLNEYLYGTCQNWVGIGKSLGRLFNYDPRVTIAVSPAGAIPYYSRLKSIDILGVNDPWVARYGNVIEHGSVGHTRYAPLEYLQKRKVDLIIDHPAVLDKLAFMQAMEKDEKQTGFPVIGIPVDNDRVVVVTCIPGNPIVDKVIERNGWKIYR